MFPKTACTLSIDEVRKERREGAGRDKPVESKVSL